jgi:Prp8 binding protein
MQGHVGTVTDVHWMAGGSRLVSCSIDKMASVWDAETGVRQRRFRGHTAFINDCCPMSVGDLFATAADDGRTIVWDARYKHPVHTFKGRCQRTAVCWDRTGTTVRFRAFVCVMVCV